MFERTGWFRVRTYLVNLCMLIAQFSSSVYPLFSGNLSGTRSVNQQQTPFSLGLGLWSFCTPSCPMAQTLWVLCLACSSGSLCVLWHVSLVFPTGRHASFSTLLCPSLPLTSIQSFCRISFTIHNHVDMTHVVACLQLSYFFPCEDHEGTWEV